MEKVILVLDQGTTSSRAVLMNQKGRIIAIAQKELTQIYPKPGWVEQDPMEIWATQMGVCEEVIQRAGITKDHLIGIGITNQRETTVLWDRKTGKPACNAISWQCRRSATICEVLKEKGLEKTIKAKTGLLLDAYFSGTKITWALAEDQETRRKAEQGDLCFGTVDSWLIWNLTRGKRHVTDITNASRTMLFNIHTLQWDGELLQMMGIPVSVLPEVLPSIGIFGKTDPGIFGERSLSIASVAGDQQAALFGNACYHEGDAKNTYGTGCFMLMNTGPKPVTSHKGLLTTIAWSDGDEVQYALEGSVFNAGTIMQWLRDELRIFTTASESDQIAQSVKNTNGVYFVPAFNGLGAPWWDMYARGLMIGLTRDTKSAHIVRAGLEAIAYQTRDVMNVMEEEAGIVVTSLRTDGGASANDFLMQFQADILEKNVIRSASTETTALGAGFMAGIALGVWKGTEEIEKLWQCDREFAPEMDSLNREKLVKGWEKAVLRSMEWEKA